MAVLTLLSMAFLLTSRSQRTFKVEINVKAVLTSLNMAFLPISRARFKQRFIPLLAVLCKFSGDFWVFGKDILF